MLPGDQRQQQRVREAVCRERDKGSSRTIFLDLEHQPTNRPKNPSACLMTWGWGQDGAALQRDPEPKGSLALAPLGGLTPKDPAPARSADQFPPWLLLPLLYILFPPPFWRGSLRSGFSSAGDSVTAPPLSCRWEADQVSLFSDSCLVNMNKENSGDSGLIGAMILLNS